MKNILFTLAFSFFLIGAFAQNTSLSSYYNNGELIVLSQDKNATVQAITPELRPGKEIRIFIQTSNYSNQNYTYNPVTQTSIKITYKNGKTAVFLPIDPDKFIRKIYNNYVLGEVIAGFSSGYSNSLAGNQTATYQKNTQGTVYGENSSLSYNQSESGIIQFYDQNEVNRRNEIDRQNMINRANNFNSSISSLDESMMRTNTIRPNHSQAGYVVFKAKKQKNSVIGTQCKFWKQ